MNAPMPAAPAAYFKPRRLGHVNLWVDDLAVSERFYNETCGLTVEFTEPDLIATFLGTGHTPHDLGMMQTTRGVDRYGRNGLLQLPGSIGLTPGLNHMAWEMENEAALVAAWRRLKADGVPTDITVDHQVAHSVYMFDPDGNYNEFYCDTVKQWRSVLHGAMELITSAWDPDVPAPATEGLYEDAPALRRVEGAALHPYRITHAVLVTVQPDALIDFYRRVAGLRIVAARDGVTYLGGSHAAYPYNLVILRGDAPAYHHAAFELAGDDELDAAIASLAARGIQPVRTVERPWKRSIFLADPDGQYSEWYVRRNAAPDPVPGDLPLAWVV
ncbi:MAG TPA: VOC family protein [Stellaceae bacterium]